MPFFTPDIKPNLESVPMVELCWTGTTLYALDYNGNVWYIEMKTGSWALHGNPTIDDLNRLKEEMGKK